MSLSTYLSKGADGQLVYLAQCLEVTEIVFFLWLTSLLEDRAITYQDDDSMAQ